MILKNDTLYFRCNYQDCSIPVEDILYIQSEEDYVCLYVTGSTRRFTFLSTLTEATNTLKKRGFARCHRSYVVNMARVTAVRPRVDGYKAILEGGKHIPVGRAYKDSFRQAHALRKKK